MTGKNINIFLIKNLEQHEVWKFIWSILHGIFERYNVNVYERTPDIDAPIPDIASTVLGFVTNEPRKNEMNTLPKNVCPVYYKYTIYYLPIWRIITHDLLIVNISKIK